MYRLVALFVGLALLAGCAPKKLTPDEIAAERKAIQSMVVDMWKAYESKNPAGLTSLYTTSGDLQFFGTDSAEIIRTIAQWETQAKNDLETFQSIKFGEPRNVSVILSDDGGFGSIVCECPADLTVGGQQSHFLYRFASSVRKENGRWRFVHGMIAVATVGQSSADIVAKMKSESVKM